MKVPLTAVLAALAIVITASPSTGAPLAPSAPKRCILYVPDAAKRSGLPEDVIMRVMLAESGGSSRIVSVKGAIGCMQIMPATWTYLTERYTLGSDPFDARMNMIGGAMYLAELASRYGWPGAFSAYNAGPGRYQRFVQGGLALPTETIAYTARLGGNVDGRPTPVPAPRWQQARLFLTRPASDIDAVSPSAPTRAAENAEVRPRNALFPLSGVP